MNTTIDNCIFCKIIAGQAPAEKIYEDETVVVILSIEPVNFGHSLVIPKEHFVDLIDTPDEVAYHMAKVAKRVGHALKESLIASAFNVGVNNGAAAGQVVFHAHWHVIPRYETDEFTRWPKKEYGEGEFAVTGEQVRAALSEHFVVGKIHDDNRPWPVTDGIVVSAEGKILLTKRNIEPEKGLWCLPGGHIDYGESPQDAIVREVKEETGLDANITQLIGVYGGAGRDPRRHSISTVFALGVNGGELEENTEVNGFGWFTSDELPENIGFDHRQMIDDYFEKQNKN